MAATANRRYARPQDIKQITMPPKSSPKFNLPMSRVAIEPPELDDTSTIYSGSRASGGTFSTPSLYSSGSGRDRDSRPAIAGIDIVDELTDRMNNVTNFTQMDRSLAKQAQISGTTNAKQRELEDLRAQTKRRIARSRVNFAEAIEAGNEARANLEYSDRKMSALKSRAKAEYADEYETARSSRRR